MLFGDQQIFLPSFIPAGVTFLGADLACLVKAYPLRAFDT